MKYFVRAAGREVVIEVDGEQVIVDGRVVHAHVTPIPGTPLSHLTIDDRSALIAAASEGRGAWSLSSRGERWEVEVIDERTRHIRSLTGEGQPKAGGGVLRAPMPGMVVRVTVEPGQTVAAGTGMVVLEAMKMENELRAPGPATVKAVKVQPGQAVEKGQVLVELEP